MEISMFLTKEELRELTGYVYHCRQIDWLRRHNWRFEVTAQERPKVARSYFESRLGGASVKQEAQSASLPVRPNFQALIQQKIR
jgi:hypothetical protein